MNPRAFPTATNAGDGRKALPRKGPAFTYAKSGHVIDERTVSAGVHVPAMTKHAVQPNAPAVYSEPPQTAVHVKTLASYARYAGKSPERARATPRVIQAI